MNQWIVHVSNFGKIEKADVEISPLILFIGDNNSGKSYFMTLLYGLLTIDFYWEGYQFHKKSPLYRDCCGILDKVFADTEEIGRSFLKIQGEQTIKFQQLLNECLEINKEKFLMNLFRRYINLDKLWVEFPKEKEYSFHITCIKKENGQKEYQIQREDGVLAGFSIAIDKQTDLCHEVNDFFLFFIFCSMLRQDIEKGVKKKSVYLPTARTGFLLTYKALVGNTMREKFLNQGSETYAEKMSLARPAADFLVSLSEMTSYRENEKFQNLVKFIEENLISGHILTSDIPSSDIMYTPNGLSAPIPMYVSSGVVTEVTPLLLFLKYMEFGALLIEEPEAALHLKLQWEMARVLIRLANAGVFTVATTHSDIILQHINNMIKAFDREFNPTFLESSRYGKEDFLNREMVSVYQFCVQPNQKTQVRKLPCGDYGFEAMTFYDTLKQLNEEIVQIEKEEQ